MGSPQYPGQNISGAGIPHSHYSTVTVHDLLGYPGKLNVGCSPLPLSSSQFLKQGSYIMTNSQDVQGSAEANPGRSLSHDSSFETANSSSNKSPSFMPELVRMQITPQSLHPSQPDGTTLKETETILMSPSIAESNASLVPLNKVIIRHSESSKSRPRSAEQELFQQQNRRKKMLCQGGEKKQESIRVVDIRGLLIKCAEAISENRSFSFEILADETEAAVSISGDPMQRLGAYMLEGLKARREASGTTIYRSLRCWEMEGRTLLSSYMQSLYDICPYFKFGYMAANGAIAEAIRNEDHIHIIDFQVAHGTQWLTLIQALAGRPGGPPHVRITGIGDPISTHSQGDDDPLKDVGRQLMALSRKFNIPLEFKVVPVQASDVTRDMLDIRPGEAVAVNFTFHLHHTPDESVDVNNPRDGLLRMVKGLSPKVTTLVEQESNMNTTLFLTRFMEALDYYHAMFESIDETLPRNHRERINVEQHCLAKDIVNIIACEGKERVERHELLGKWRSRLSMAGFKPYPLSSYVNSVIRYLLRSYNDKYALVEKDGAMLLGWKDRPLISTSAWH